ncbi:MAG: two-component system, OmpR family, sensor histidine kinase SenX3, partial [Pseudonocardiales bacterium]|nr:two-component system, OmpR family, sensor histidine kinase SenX3 [Pseudonocardiales bacterium]
MSAFAAALFVRRSAASFGPGPAAPPAPTTSLAARALGALDVGVVVLDRDETVIFANPVSRRMGVVDGDRLTLPVLSELVRSVTDSGEADSVTLDLSTAGRGPEHVSFLVRAMPLRDGGRVGSVVLRFSDITDARRLEQVRRDFVANVSHELKTPVSALTLLAEAVQDAADEPEMVARFAARIQHEGSRLARLVGELMELSRVQGADPMPGAGEVEVCAVLGEALARTRLAAEQASILVTMSCAPGLRVRGNEAQLATAVANLVDNAVAYSGNGTRVAVTARPSTDEDARPTVDISVTDQGIGIAEADRDRIFERFYRVDPARSRATGGTG